VQRKVCRLGVGYWARRSTSKPTRKLSGIALVSRRSAGDAVQLRVGGNRRPVARGRVLVVWVGLAASVGLGYLTVRNVRWDRVWEALANSNYWWLIPALLLLAAANLVRARRWQSLFQAQTRPPYVPTLEAMLVGQLFNNVLPARAGEVARIVFLHRRSGASRAEVTGTVLVERAFDVLALLGLLFVALPWFPSLSWIRAAAWLAIGLALSVAIVSALLVRYEDRPLEIASRPLQYLPFVSLEWVGRATANVGRGLAGIRRWRNAAAAGAWTIGSWLAIALSNWVLMQAFHLGLPFSAGLLIAIATGLGMVIPSAPGAVGIFEAATVVGLHAYGVPTSQALSYALVLHAMNLVPYLLAGGALLRLGIAPQR
jgi:glycosyltransferase 2 family protein